MRTREKATVERVKELVDYAPLTGVFTWKKAWGKRRIGDVAGIVLHGYVRIAIDRKWCSAHRLAWIFLYGHWPDGEIDHLNGDRSDNRECNLREASFGTNMQNMRCAKSTNRLGVLGVGANGYGRYHARICVDRKAIQIGTFDTAAEASAAYLKAKRRLHAGCTI